MTAILVTGTATRTHARMDSVELAEFKKGFPELFQNQNPRVQPMDVPDIFGPGAVLNVGHIFLKVTNFAVIGNPFTNLSTDPSAQWPGASGIEYLNFMLLGVGGVDKTATDPTAIRRVSYYPEWRPPTLGPDDRMYKTYDGKVFGLRNVDDDHDANSHDPLDRAQYFDEDFLDGRDNDGDGLIDEDYGAIGQQMYTCVISDDTPQSYVPGAAEKHVPLHLEVRQSAFAFSVPGFEDFNAISWTVINRANHPIDSMYVGIRWDIDSGPAEDPAYYNDDDDIPFFPQGDFPVVLSTTDKWGSKLDPKGYRRQQNHALIPSFPPESTALCPRVNIKVNGFSVMDHDGDAGRTPGIASICLLGHTIDPLGLMAPKRVAWNSFRSFVAGTPFTSGGNPITDQQRFEMFASKEGIDPETGFIVSGAADQGDIQGWASVGPFGVTDEQGIGHPIPIGGSFDVTIAFCIQQSNGFLKINEYPADYAAYLAGKKTTAELFDKFPALENAFAAQVAYEGVYDNPPSLLDDDEHINTPDFHGRETRMRAPPGLILSASDCRDEGSGRQINQFGYTWFDFDCDYCTGVWVFGTGHDFGHGPGSGKMLRRWNTAAPPPNPGTNVGSAYNFSDNPDRAVPAAQDNRIVLAWDNLSEVTVDPEAGDFDLRSYKIWKVSNWRRVGGTTGPGDDDWTLVAHLRYFDYYTLGGQRLASNQELFSDARMDQRGFTQSAKDSVHAGQPICPQVYIPNLSVQTIVLDKSAFTRQAAKDWVLGHGYAVNGNDPSPDDGTVWRFRQSEGECKAGSLHTVGIESSVRAEACLNALARVKGFKVPICLFPGDLWDPQTGDVIRPTPDTCPQRNADGTCVTDTIACIKDGAGGCAMIDGKVNAGSGVFIPVSKKQYPVGRYRFVDREVQNGFLYFYSVTAGDSVGGAYTGDGSGLTENSIELYGRRSAVEAEAIFPQSATRPVGGVWVVPNPYRGYTDLTRRPSAWDLVPNASDPTGTHLDFMGLPKAPWTIKVFTVSGDLVQTLRSDDPVNESVRGGAKINNPNYNPALPADPVNNPKTISVPGYNRQADGANDGEARWNLISRNGQDIVSGVYIFVVESKEGTQRGKFVVIR